MKLAVTVLMSLSLVACSPATVLPLPTAPGPSNPANPAPPPTPSSGIVWVMVIEKSGSGVCIVGATLQVVNESGEAAESIEQGPCDVWGYSGGVEFKGLTPGIPLRLRASAPGFGTQDQTFLPFVSAYQAVFIELVRNK